MIQKSQRKTIYFFLCLSVMVSITALYMLEDFIPSNSFWAVLFVCASTQLIFMFLTRMKSISGNADNQSSNYSSKDQF